MHKQYKYDKDCQLVCNKFHSSKQHYRLHRKNEHVIIAVNCNLAWILIIIELGYSQLEMSTSILQHHQQIKRTTKPLVAAQVDVQTLEERIKQCTFRAQPTVMPPKTAW